MSSPGLIVIPVSNAADAKAGYGVVLVSISLPTASTRSDSNQGPAKSARGNP